MPGWEIGGGRSDICGTQSYLSLYPAWKGRCRSQSGDVPRDGWLCFCGKDENDKTGVRQNTKLNLSARVLQGLDGGPVVVADGPCDVGKGYPGEDLLVGVTSYDPYLPYYRDCNVLTSISYYRDWILETMAGKTPPSECKIKEKPSPLPSDPFLCEKCKVGHVLYAISHFHSGLQLGYISGFCFECEILTCVAVLCRNVPKKRNRQRHHLLSRPLCQSLQLSPRHHLCPSRPLRRSLQLNPRYRCCPSRPLRRSLQLNPRHRCCPSRPLRRSLQLNPRHHRCPSRPLRRSLLLLLVQLMVVTS